MTSYEKGFDLASKSGWNNINEAVRFAKEDFKYYGGTFNLKEFKKGWYDRRPKKRKSNPGNRDIQIHLINGSKSQLKSILRKAGFVVGGSAKRKSNPRKRKSSTIGYTRPRRKRAGDSMTRRRR